MTFERWLALLGLLDPFIIVLLGTGLKWISDVSKRATSAFDLAKAAMLHSETIQREREVDKAAYNRRLERAEEAAAAIREIAKAVDHQSEVFNLQLENIVGRMTEHNEMVREQFVAIRHEQKNIQQVINTLAGGRRAN